MELECALSVHLCACVLSCKENKHLFHVKKNMRGKKENNG